MAPTLDIRRYHGEHPHHQHDFTQLVLPISGRMEIDVEGHGARLDAGTAALVVPGARHAQVAEAGSRFLVLDCPPGDWQEQVLDSLAQRIYIPISPATRRLIEFAELVDARTLGNSAGQLAPLLLSSLACSPLSAPSGIQALLAQLQANPAAAWTNDAMARLAGMSLSQLHLRFRALFDQTPQAWLADVRLHKARQWLTDSRLPIAEIALRCGFSDQAALTRAMHRLCGVTPAAYRKSLGKKPGTFRQ
ncbi:AraC family transcriptional regulator [Pseudomonas sp. Leaf127]|uniref:AraC family transcriptional regulator n=1 Tax=Pseudomonas sp. Leaf127 TaxID=1736267 RepID=UPI000AA149D0|nr:AraC family transcriptional regulator [Pseudomonas sp. Leaf127]